MKAKTILAAIMAASAVAAMTAGADSTGTYTTNGVAWTWKTVDNSGGSPSYRLGGGTTTSTAMPTDTVLDASLIPWGYIDDGGVYRVVDTISSYAFKDCKGLAGNLVVPSTVRLVGTSSFTRTGITRAIVNATQDGSTIIGSQAFFGCGSLKGVLLNGSGNVNMYQPFYGAAALKLVVFGPRIVRANNSTSPFFNVNGCRIFYSASQTSWDAESNWNNNEVIKYGAGQDFDMEFSDTENVVTVYPTTETSVTNALAWAPLFKDALGYDMKIAITNRIEVSQSLEITESMLQSVTLETPPWYLTFAVKNQEQLDNVFAAVSVDTPIIIDIEGSGKNQITVPNGRKAAILAKSGCTFGRKLNGIIISFR